MPTRRHVSAPRRLYIEWIAVAIVTTLLIVALVVGRLTDRLDNIIYDRALTASERPTPDDIVIVGIDNRSLQAIGRWPWPRSVHAQALDRLAEAKPRAVGYDVLFVEPTAEDAILAAAVRRSPTYLPMVVDVPGTNGAPYDVALPAGPLASAAAAISHVNLHFDGDRIIRKTYLEEGSDRRVWLQLGALMAGVKPSQTEYREAGLWQKRPILIPYAGPAGHIRTISFVDLLDGRVPPELLAGRYVLIGASADGMGDSYPTPTTGETSQMPGVEIQANMLDALLRGHAITPAPPLWIAGVALVAVWSLLAGFLNLGPRGSVKLAAATFVAILLLSFALFRFAHVWLPPAPALIGLIFVYPVWSWRRLQAVSSYMTDELRQLSREQDDFPRAAELPDNAREVTIQLALLAQAVGRLRDLRRFLSDSLRNIPDALFVTDLEGKILLANGEGRALLQRLSLPDQQGSDLHPLFARMRQSDEEEDRLAPFAADAPEQGQAEVVIEELGQFDARYASQFDADNRRVGIIVRVIDLTRLKRAERHREEALQLLSHDMRAPQSSILTVLEGNRADIPEPVSQRIGNYARRTLDLAEDFVQLARAEAKPLDREELDINDVVIDAADLLWPQADARRIRIDVATGDDPALMIGDRQLLTRAIANLIGNAIKYSEADSLIACAVDVAPETLRITIADQGTGMTEEQLAHLFGRFQQGPREGVGLGLAMVQMVIQRHLGTIGCDSEVGRGTTFAITLPALAG